MCGIALIGMDFSLEFTNKAHYIVLNGTEQWAGHFCWVYIKTVTAIAVEHVSVQNMLQ